MRCTRNFFKVARKSNTTARWTSALGWHLLPGDVIFHNGQHRRLLLAYMAFHKATGTGVVVPLQHVPRRRRSTSSAARSRKLLRPRKEIEVDVETLKRYVGTLRTPARRRRGADPHRGDA